MKNTTKKPTKGLGLGNADDPDEQYFASKYKIDPKIVYLAFYNNSFHADRRAESEPKGFEQLVRKYYREIRELAKLKPHRDWRADLERFLDGLLDRQLAWYRAMSNTSSWMVTGRGGRNEYREKKKRDIEHRRRGELINFEKFVWEKVKDSYEIKDELKKSSKESIEAVKVRIADLLAQRAAGPVYRYSEKMRVLKDRLAAEEKLASEEPTNYTFDGGTLFANVTQNRWQIFFDQRPDEATKTILKRNGFKWAPSAGAWQRYYNTFPLRRFTFFKNLVLTAPEAQESAEEAEIDFTPPDTDGLAVALALAKARALELTLAAEANGLAGSIDQDTAENLLAQMAGLAEAFRFLKYNEANFRGDFGAEGTVTTPLGEVAIDYAQFDKIASKERTRYFGLIKPTLQAPLLVVKLATGRTHFIKTFVDWKSGVFYFVSIAQDEQGWYDVRTNHERTRNQIIRTLMEGNIIYQNSSITALNGADPPLPTYAALRIGLPFQVLAAKVPKNKETADSLAGYFAQRAGLGDAASNRRIDLGLAMTAEALLYHLPTRAWANYIAKKPLNLQVVGHGDELEHLKGRSVPFGQGQIAPRGVEFQILQQYRAYQPTDYVEVFATLLPDGKVQLSHERGSVRFRLEDLLERGLLKQMRQLVGRKLPATPLSMRFRPSLLSTEIQDVASKLAKYTKKEREQGQEALNWVQVDKQGWVWASNGFVLAGKKTATELAAPMAVNFTDGSFKEGGEFDYQNQQKSANFMQLVASITAGKPTYFVGVAAAFKPIYNVKHELVAVSMYGKELAFKPQNLKKAFSFFHSKDVVSVSLHQTAMKIFSLDGDKLALVVAQNHKARPGETPELPTFYEDGKVRPRQSVFAVNQVRDDRDWLATAKLRAAQLATDGLGAVVAALLY
jgi:hypothetical protein